MITFLQWEDKNAVLRQDLRAASNREDHFEGFEKKRSFEMNGRNFSSNFKISFEKLSFAVKVRMS